MELKIGDKVQVGDEVLEVVTFEELDKQRLIEISEIESINLNNTIVSKDCVHKWQGKKIDSKICIHNFEIYYYCPLCEENNKPIEKDVLYKKLIDRENHRTKKDVKRKKKEIKALKIEIKYLKQDIKETIDDNNKFLVHYIEKYEQRKQNKNNIKE